MSHQGMASSCKYLVRTTNGSAVRVLTNRHTDGHTDRHTDTWTDGTYSITSTDTAGGNNAIFHRYLILQVNTTMPSEEEVSEEDPVSSGVLSNPTKDPRNHSIEIQG